MKFYNPFKPHIVENALGEFKIRKFSTFGWEYLSEFFYWNTGDSLWIEEFRTLEKAKEFLKQYYHHVEYTKNREEKRKKVTVHNET